VFAALFQRPGGLSFLTLAGETRWYELVKTRDQLDPGPQTPGRLKVFHTHIAGDGDAHQPPVPERQTHMNTAIANLTQFRRSLAVAGAFAALTVATTSFAAAPSVDPPAVSVRFDDLNLSTANGVNSLYRRISVAARQVCPDVSSRDLVVVAAAQRCQATAVSRAVSKLNNPQLALVHAAHVSRG